MKIAVIGTGAMGSIFSCRLSQVADVIMFGTWREQIDTINDIGLWLEDPEGRKVRFAVQATDDLASLGQVELALILVKSWQTRRAAEQARQILIPGGIALTLQNGLGNLEILQDKVGLDRAALGVTSEGATMLKAGHVRHAGHGKTHLATELGQREGLERVAQQFNAAGFETELVRDSLGLVWGKLAVNAGINPLTALLEVPNGALLNYPTSFELMRLAAEEVAELARRLRIDLPYSSASEQVTQVARATASNRSSMFQDILRGMPTEIDAITGAIVRMGRENGFETPINLAFFELVKAKVSGRQWHTLVDQLPQPARGKFLDLLSSKAPR